MSPPSAFRCKSLVLDAGPLLSLSPLRGLAETYFTVPEVLAELKDKRAREHFEQLGLMSGVHVKIQSPNAASLSHVIQCARKTGDYNVLSHPDLCVLALTHQLHEDAAKATKGVNGDDSLEPCDSATSSLTVDEISSSVKSLSLHEPSDQSGTSEHTSELNGEEIRKPDEDERERLLDPLDVDLQPLNEAKPTSSPLSHSSEPIFDDPSDSDDGEGEWITPSNVALHKSRALDLLPEVSTTKGRRKVDQTIHTGCMTADFAMQNVLLQMGLNLIDVEGKRIEKVKTWVLRCHACFKICKDNSKKFCPSCGNPTLLRTSVTVSAPGAAADAPAMQVHLKPKFQYKIRGTKYPIPQPKAGSAKSGPGNNLILREDQIEYMRAKKKAEGKQEREEAKMMKTLLSRGPEGATGIGSWMDPDWIPEIVSVGAGGKGRTTKSAGMDGDLPQIGFGKRNPNAVRKRRK